MLRSQERWHHFCQEASGVLKHVTYWELSVVEVPQTTDHCVDNCFSRPRPQLTNQKKVMKEPLGATGIESFFTLPHFSFLICKLWPFAVPIRKLTQMWPIFNPSKQLSNYYRPLVTFKCCDWLKASHIQATFGSIFWQVLQRAMGGYQEKKWGQVRKNSIPVAPKPLTMSRNSEVL